MRGQLDDSTIATINAQLPDIDDLVKNGPRYGAVEENSMGFRKDQAWPVAGVCLRDEISILGASQFAVYEAIAHQHWFTEHEPEGPSKELTIAWYGRFYADDAALRLYAVGEDLAASILFLLRVDQTAFASFAKTLPRSITSLQARVGLYLKRHHAADSITQACWKLEQSSAWKWTRDYRDDWVHQQPRLMEGFGIQYRRQPRWKVVEDAATGDIVSTLSVTSGDKPACTVNDLISARGVARGC